MSDTALTKAVPLIASFEGYRSAPYRDIRGVWTIAYGTIYLPNGTRVAASTPPCTEQQAMAWLQADVAKILISVRAMVIVSLSDNEAAALTSFAYNLGVPALRGSFLLTFLNRDERQEAARQFDSWVYAGGKVVPALRTRRAKERALFETPNADVVSQAGPHAPPTADDLNANELNGTPQPWL